MSPSVSVAEQKLKTHFAALYTFLLVSWDDLNNMVGSSLVLCEEPVLHLHAVKQRCDRRCLCVNTGQIPAEIGF